MLNLKRAYEPPAKGDGFRVLVEQLWPRGVRKADAALDAWLKDVAPSPRLRQWFGHDPAKWEDFRKRYWAELKGHAGDVELLRRKAKGGKVTLVYGSRDQQHNAAVVLKGVLEKHGKR